MSDLTDEVIAEAISRSRRELNRVTGDPLRLQETDAVLLRIAHVRALLRLAEEALASRKVVEAARLFHNAKMRLLVAGSYQEVQDGFTAVADAERAIGAALDALNAPSPADAQREG